MELLPMINVYISYSDLLEFSYIFKVSDRKDPNWWQASHVENPDVVGLIPSPELEERRKAYVPPEADFVHKISICGARVCTFLSQLQNLLSLLGNQS